jgi:hypothetical protein
VSARHIEIRKEGDRYRLYDLGSTNGTYVNGRRVAHVRLEGPTVIRLGGADGLELGFVLEGTPAADLTRTIVALPGEEVRTGEAEKAAAGISKEDERLLSEAVARARIARRAGAANQTMLIMRDVLQGAVRRTGKRFKGVIAALVVALMTVSAYGSWKIVTLKREKQTIDGQIRQLENALESGGQSSDDQERLIDRLNAYEGQAAALEHDVFYRVGVREHAGFLEREIRALMQEFGAETYSIPPEFVEQVKKYIGRYQGPDRPHIERVLGPSRRQLDIMRGVFEQEHLPPDLAFMVLVESAFLSEQSSRAGAVGLWQFTPATARAYGLSVAKGADERLDIRKATRAGSKYIRDLILDFGAGSSVMLALAAYNSGPGRVRHAVRKVPDPIKQRNFWYLYRTHALPEETREYVPKVIAAMIIGRHPERFGF